MESIIQAIEKILADTSDENLDRVHSALMNWQGIYRISDRQIRKIAFVRSVFDAIDDEWRYRNEHVGVEEAS